MEYTPTAHNSAINGSFAKTVIMPGDPLRSKLIADQFLSNAVLINNVRGIQGYTGLYNGKKVSVMASGMGMPSMGIYSYELFKFYDVDTIIRVGSAGACDDNLHLKDIVIADTVVTDSNYDNMYKNNNGNTTLNANPELVAKIKNQADTNNLNSVIGTIFSTDTFYGEANQFKDAQSQGYKAIEMEAGALYHNASILNKQAIAICTISDCPLQGLSCSSLERQTAFTDMIKLALDVATK